MNKKEILVCGMLAITLILLMVNIFLTTNILKNKERIVTSVNMTNNLVEITKNVKPAVVRIVAETNQSPDSYFSSEIIKVDTGGLASIGTGFIVDPEGYIITANHVITGSNNIQVILFDEDKTEVKKAKIVKQNTQKDIAVIKISKPKRV